MGTILMGGVYTNKVGYFVKPTVILFDLFEGAYEEMIEGPILCLYISTTPEEAFSTANMIVSVGIGANSSLGVFGRDLSKVSKLTRKGVIKANIIMVNNLSDAPIRAREGTDSIIIWLCVSSICHK